MRRDGFEMKWAAAALLLLSPVALILYLPLAQGSGFDVFALGREAPLALALCTPGVLVLLQYLTPPQAAATVAPHHRRS